MRISTLWASLILGFFLNSHSALAISWIPETVHNTKYFTLGPSSSVKDQSGNLHVFYGGASLYHGYLSGSTWHAETIDNSPQVGGGVLAAIDSSGVFHILYIDSINESGSQQGNEPEVKYARGQTGAWTIEATPFPNRALGADHVGSLVIDSNNALHFVYRDHEHIRYAVKQSAATDWNIETIPDSSGTVLTSAGFISRISMAIDSAGRPNIAYRKSNESQLKYAIKITGNWEIEVVDSSPNDSYIVYFNHNAISINSQGHVYICYIAPSSGTGGFRLKCMNNASGNWTQETIDNAMQDIPGGGNAGYLPSVYIDEQDKLHIVYYVYGYNSLKYLRYATNRNSSWEIATYVTSPSPSADAPGFTNLQLMPNGNLTSFFMNKGSAPHDGPSDLKYLVWDGSTWLEQVIDASIEQDAAAGIRSSIAIAPDGSLHAVYAVNEAYPQSSNFFLYYATNVSGSWASQKLINDNITKRHFTSDDSIIQPAIQVDPLGFIHIVYAEGNFSLSNTYYLSNRSGTWVKEFVSDRMPIDKYRLTVDQDGAAHIAYLSDDVSFVWTLFYATNRSGGWVQEQVYQYPEDMETDPETAQVAIDFKLATNGTPSSIAFISVQENPDLMLATRSSAGGWDTTVLLRQLDIEPMIYFDAFRGVLLHSPSIVMGTDNDLHFAFNAVECRVDVCIPAGIRYASYSSGNWSHSMVDEEVYFTTGSTVLYATNPDIRLDGQGKAYISYHHAAYRELRVAEVSGSCLYKKIAVDGNPMGIGDSSIEGKTFIGHTLATDPDGNLAISYHDKYNGDLKVSRSSPELHTDICLSGGATWTQPANTSGFRDIELTNAGPDSIAISGISLSSDNEFSITADNCSSEVISPSDSCSIRVAFSPLAAAARAVGYLAFNIQNTSGGQIIHTAVVASSSAGEPQGGNDGTRRGGGGGGGSGHSLLFVLLALWFRHVFRRK